MSFCLFIVIVSLSQCAECENLYEFVRIEGYVYTSPFPQSIPLSTYYNGQLQDNVLSPTSPGQGLDLYK